MKKLMGLSLFASALFLNVAGCGGSGEPTNVLENTEMSAIEQYEADMAKQEAEMNGSMENTTTSQ